jgi:hypothetical protein
MAVSGNTRHPDYRQLTLLYEFQKLKQWTRRAITPTDIDGRFLIHSGNDYNGHKGDFFLWLDLKTTGTPTSAPQRDAFDALLRRGCGNDALIIAEHPVLKEKDSIEFPDDIERFAIRVYDKASRSIAQTKWFLGDSGKVGWWVQQWFRHCEEHSNHFITAFRQSSGIYPPSRNREWVREMESSVPIKI